MFWKHISSSSWGDGRHPESNKTQLPCAVKTSFPGQHTRPGRILHSDLGMVISSTFNNGESSTFNNDKSLCNGPFSNEYLDLKMVISSTFNNDNQR